MTPLIIDVREPFEFQSGHVQGALNIPPSELLAGAKELDRLNHDTPIIVYCRTGSRSNTARYILESRGFTSITNGISKDHVEKLLMR
jgi:phage shock protein E